MAALLPLLLLVLGACGAVSAGDVMHGITFGTGPLSAPTAGGPLSNTSDTALTALAATGATWVQLHPVFLAASVAEPGPLVPAPGSPNTPELAHLLTRAHSLGLQVLLAPLVHVNLTIPGNCRGPSCGNRSGDPDAFGCGFSGNEWSSFVETYHSAITEVLKGVQAAGVPVNLFALGTGLSCAVARAGPALAASVLPMLRAHALVERVTFALSEPAVFAGLGLPDWTQGGSAFEWIGQLDVLGCLGQFALRTPTTNATVEQIVAAWRAGPLDTLAQASHTYGNKTVVLTRLGYQSRSGSHFQPAGIMAQDPTDGSCWVRSVDVAVQAAAYTAALQLLPAQPWFAGAFWWLWRSDGSDGGLADDGFSPRGKPAEQVLRQAFGASQPAAAVLLVDTPPTATATVFPPGYGPAAAARHHNGMCFGSDQWSAPSIALDSETARQSLLDLHRTGANAVRLLISWYFDSIQSHTIYPLYRPSPLATPTDDEIITFVGWAKALNMTVQVAPYIDANWEHCSPPTPEHLFPQQHCPCRGPSCGKIPGTNPKAGRGCSEEEWAKFYANYTGFIMHYAEVAEKAGAEQLCIGAELESPFAHAEQPWRELAKRVRGVFKGKLTAAINSGQAVHIPPLPWLDVLDFIGVEGYFSLDTGPPGWPGSAPPTVEQIILAWAEPTAQLEELSAITNRSIMFTEVGYQSRFASNNHPASTNSSNPADCSVVSECVDLEEQAHEYEALLRNFYDKDWFLGVNWWLWRSDPTAGGTSDASFSPKGKPAQTILRRWYTGRL